MKDLERLGESLSSGVFGTEPKVLSGADRARCR